MKKIEWRNLLLAYFRWEENSSNAGCSARYEWNKRNYAIVIYFQNTSVYVNILTLVCISVERWKAVTSPLRNPLWNTQRAIVVIWIVAMLLSLPEPFTISTYPAVFERPNFTTTVFFSHLLFTAIRHLCYCFMRWSMRNPSILVILPYYAVMEPHFKDLSPKRKRIECLWLGHTNSYNRLIINRLLS